MEAVHHWRLRKERLTGATKTDCCKMPIVRPRVVNFKPCEFCGTRLSWTDKGASFTKFGENYLKDRKEEVEGILVGERGFPTDLKQRKMEEAERVME